MADFRINLSDGVTTISFYEGNTTLQAGGLSLPTPRLISNRVGNPFFNGFRIGSSRYDNRFIALTIKIEGTSLADLQTSVRAIQRLLNDARQRMLSGYGNQVYLEIQWGDTAGQSTYFDVLQGSLDLPPGWASAPFLRGFTLLNCTLSLECEPLGRYTNQNIVQETLENSQSVRREEDSFLVDDDAEHELFGNGVGATFVEGQTFLTTAAHTMIGFAAKLYREGLPGNVDFRLYATAGGLPVGGVLATGTLDLDGITTEPWGDWIYVAFGTPYALNNATVYALVVEATGGNAANSIHWRADPTAGYAGGQRVTRNAGAWGADAGADFLFATFVAETMANYQNVTTAEGHGDVPAKVYWKIALAGVAGNKKMWLSKRSGARQTDDLWIEGEENTSRTTAVTANNHVTFIDEVEIGIAGGTMNRAQLDAVENVPANTLVCRVNYSIATPPRGLFRVLLRCRTTEVNDAAEYAKMAWGIGYSYGDKVGAPVLAAGDYIANSADDTWEIIDLGLFSIPPIPESDIAGLNSLELRVYQYALDALRQEYISPDVTDAAGGWANPGQAWDGNTGTAANVAPGAAAWTGNLDLGYVAGVVTPCSGIRAWVDIGNHEPLVDLVDIDCYYDGAWHGLYNGVFTGGLWEYFYFADGAHRVEAVRIRMWNNAGAPDDCQIFEVDYLRADYHWDIDYMFLLPIDEGVVIIDAVGVTDILAMDGITSPSNMLIISATGEVDDIPDYVGRPFDLGRESTRFYILRDDIKTATFASDVKYQPQFLVI